MSITLPPLPRPGPLGLIQYAGVDMLQYASAVSAEKDAEIAGLRAELLKSLADNAALRERVKVLEDALRKAVVQNEHDMLMTGEELRAARAALGDKTPTTPLPSPSPRS